MKLFKWSNGRQNSGYLKMPIILNNFFLPFDVYLLKYPKGSYIKEHVDRVDGYRHYRCNIIVKNATSGGKFHSEHNIIGWNRLKIFRPDKYKHSLSTVSKGCRYVLSIGIAVKR